MEFVEFVDFVDVLLSFFACALRTKEPRSLWTTTIRNAFKPSVHYELLTESKTAVAVLESVHP